MSRRHPWIKYSHLSVNYLPADVLCNLYIWVVFTWGQFWPSGIVVGCVCVCVCACVRLSILPCVNHELVHAITHHLHKLGSPNLDHRCKRPCLRSLLFLGWLTLTFKVKFNFKVKIYSMLSLSAWSPVQARITKFGPEVQNTLNKIPIIFGVDWAWRSNLN